MPVRKSTADKSVESVPKLLAPKDAAKAQDPYVHIYHGGAICRTDKRGYPTPQIRDLTELTLHAIDVTNGVISLWEKETTLRWRFNDASMTSFVDPTAAKTYLRRRLVEALALWGNAAPVRFSEVSDCWDFEVVFESTPKCNSVGCVLARAFLPDSSPRDITLYCTLLEQTQKAIVETLAHELGHVFGLRHFFAKMSEGAFPSEIFGKQNRHSIMNYGEHSRMTARDRSDLKALYTKAWSGALTKINGTPIKLVRPFSHTRVQPVPLALAARTA